MRGPARYDSEPPTQRVRTWASWAESDDLLAHSALLSAEWHAVGDALPLASAQALARHRAAWADLATSGRSLGLPAHRAYDLTQWLPNVFLEKSDRASMLSGVEVRVPYLDSVVARAATDFVPQDSRKTPLREALKALLPEARLPARKMGLSVDIPRLMASSGLDEYATYCLFDQQSVLRAGGSDDVSLLQRRAGRNSALSFRLGMLGLWQHEVLEATS